MILDIKPLSVNQCWQGHRYKSKAYKSYEETVLYMLRDRDFEVGDKMRIVICFGFSNKQSDIDNCIKPILDILQKKYGFNDSHIYELEVRKTIVKKGEEYIRLLSEVIN